MRRLHLLVILLFVVPGCGEEGTEVWIYTSIYPHVIEQMTPALESEFPGVRFRWYQKGSEQVAARLTTELAGSGTPCDLLMTSDPFYYAELKAAGHLLAYESPAARGVPSALRDPEHAFVTVRLPLMVLAYNRDAPAAKRPAAFEDLTQTAFRSQIAMGDPLKSGTTFTTVAALVRKHGWAFVEALRKNDIMAAGGNSTVLNKLETKERVVGIILLENLLPRLGKAPLEVVYPSDGAIPVPSPIAIMKGSDQTALAKRVYDYMFSKAMQDAIVAGHMYSPFPDRDPPPGARPWSEITRYPWDNDFLSWVTDQRADIKRRFRDIMRK